MRTVKDRAIVLRRKPIGEADILLTLYTKHHGKVRAVAKGARRVTSKLAGYTELFTEVSCHLNLDTSLPIVSQVSHEQIFDGIAHHQQLYEQLHILAELIDKGCEEREANPSLFYALQQGIATLITNYHAHLLIALLLRTMRILGYEATLDSCAHCGEPLISTHSLAWSNSHGGVVQCTPILSHGTDLSVEEVKMLRYFSTASLMEVHKLRISDTARLRLENLILNYAQHVLEKDLVAPKVALETA